MIYDKISNAKLYEGLGPLFREAFAFIAAGHDFDGEADDQWRKIHGDALYYKVTDIDTFNPAPEEYRYEHHRKYADIHCVLCGTEGIALADLEELAPDGEFNVENDCGFSKGPQLGIIHMRPGDFMICFPNDGHRCWLGDGHRIRKALFKVALDAIPEEAGR